MNWANQCECGGTFRGPPPPSGLNPCVLAFLLPLFTVVSSVSCLPSSCFSEWYGLVSADRFCIIPNHLQIVLSAVDVFLGTGCSSMDPVGLCCTGSDWVRRCVWWNLDQCWTKVVLWYNYIFSYLVSDVSCFLEKKVLEQDNLTSFQVIHILE